MNFLSAGAHTQARGAVQGAERNLRAGYSDFAGNGRRGMEKEDELKALKADVAALERKIQLTLAPPKIWSRQEKTEKTKLMNGQGKENLSQDIIYHSYIGLEKREVLEIIKTPNRSIKI